MSHFLGRSYLAVLCALIFIGWTSHRVSAQVTSVEFDQLSEEYNGVDGDPYSGTGEAEVDYSTSSLQFANVVDSNGNWVVQNLPLVPGISSEEMQFPLTDLNAGDTDGADYDNQSITYSDSVSSTPVTSAPAYNAGGAISTTLLNADNSPSSNTEDQVNNGVPGGSQSQYQTPIPNPINWSQALGTLSTLFRPTMPNVTQQRNFCGPGAAANSLAWLGALGATYTPAQLTALQNTLAGYMNNTNNGNWDDAEVAGKLQYIKMNNLPLVVHYAGGGNGAAGMAKLSTANGAMYTTANGTATRDGPVTQAWLLQQLQAGQDVEIMTATHWVVVSGIITIGPITLLQYRDDPSQAGTGTTAAQQNVINNRWSWTYFNDSTKMTNIGNGNEVLQTAVAESPVPEPASLALLAAGTFGLMSRGLRRRRAA